MTAWTEHTIETAQGTRVPVRVTGKRSGAAPVVLHLHGGAFTGGSVEASQRLPALLAQAGAVAVSADYPLAPAQPFPNALDAMFDVLDRAASLLRPMGEPALGGVRRRRGSRRQSRGGLALMARDRRAALAGTDSRFADARSRDGNLLAAQRRGRRGRLPVGRRLARLSRLARQGRASLRGAAEREPPRRRRARAGADAQRTIRCATRA